MKAIARPGGHRSRRYVFRCFDALPEVELIARGSDWVKILDRPADLRRGIVRHVKWEILPGLRVSYKEEDGIHSSFVMITSVLGGQSVGTAASVFEVHPGVLHFEELVEGMVSANDSETRGVAVARLGLGAPLAADERIVELIRQKTCDKDPYVREGALWAITYTEWPVFRTVLRRVSAEDSEPYLREFAARTIDSFDRLGLEE